VDAPQSEPTSTVSAWPERARAAAANATAALRRAQDLAAASQRANDELGGPFTCTIDRAGSLWSDTRLTLSAPGEALAFADRAVARFAATPTEMRNFGSERMSRLQQVRAHLALGDHAAAEDALAPVLATDPQHRYARCSSALPRSARSWPAPLERVPRSVGASKRP